MGERLNRAKFDGKYFNNAYIHAGGILEIRLHRGQSSAIIDADKITGIISNPVRRTVTICELFGSIRALHQFVIGDTTAEIVSARVNPASKLIEAVLNGQ